MDLSKHIKASTSGGKRKQMNLTPKKTNVKKVKGGPKFYNDSVSNPCFNIFTILLNKFYFHLHVSYFINQIRIDDKDSTILFSKQMKLFFKKVLFTPISPTL